MDYRRIVLWIIVGGATLLFVFMLFSNPLRRDAHFSSSLASSPTQRPAPVAEIVAEHHKDTDLIQNPVVVPPKQTEGGKKELPPLPPPPPTDRATMEAHRKLVAGLNREMRDATRKMYEGAFQQLRLPKDQQENVIEILTQPQKELEQQAFDAAQSGNIPAPPSPEEMQAQQAQQDQELRSVLGDAGFAAFNQYRATIPDRGVIETMNQQGANLSDSQSQQLLQVLVQERQQIQAGTAQSLNSMSPDQAIRAIDQQQVLLQRAVSDRVQNILTPDQTTTLQAVLSQQLHNGPKVR
jgi:hypothetical protein